jgi:hypothetical protein
MKIPELAGLSLLDDQELMRCRGGGFFKSFSAWAIISSLIENWQDFREGFGDGNGSKPPRH